MERNATDSGLTVVQVRALEALLSGLSLTASAKAVGTTRSTLYRWLRDPDFAAAYNGLRRELRDEVEARLLAASGRAVDALVAAIGSGNVFAALNLLRGLGLLSGHTPRLEDDADVLRAEVNERRERREFALQFMSIEGIEGLSGRGEFP